MLELQIEISFPGFTLSVNETWPAKGSVALFGPSGAGKSTLLRIIAGLERSAVGKVRFNGTCWQDSHARAFVPPPQRRAVLVFQDSRLFPHLNVIRNLHYGMTRRRGPEGPDWEHVISSFQLHDLLDRQTESLSGGEKQRVALGRALLAAPRLLLLDEPMSALDTDRRDQLLPELARLCDQFAIPVICVTHSELELRELGAEAMKMVQGKIVSRAWQDRTQQDRAGRGKPLGDVSERGVLLAARFVGIAQGGLVECQLGDETVFARRSTGSRTTAEKPGSQIRVGFDPRAVVLARDPPSGVFSYGRIKADLISVDESRGQQGQLLCLSVNGELFTMEMSGDVLRSSLPTVGEPLYLILSQPAVTDGMTEESSANCGVIAFDL